MAPKNIKELAAFSWENCDQGKWKGISEAANLLEDALTNDFIVLFMPVSGRVWLRSGSSSILQCWANRRAPTALHFSWILDTSPHKLSELGLYSQMNRNYFISSLKLECAQLSKCQLTL